MYKKIRLNGVFYFEIPNTTVIFTFIHSISDKRKHRISVYQ